MTERIFLSTEARIGEAILAPFLLFIVSLPISSNARVLLLYYMARTEHDGTITTDDAQVFAATGLTKSVAHRAKQELERAELITVIRPKYRNQRHQVIVRAVSRFRDTGNSNKINSLQNQARTNGPVVSLNRETVGPISRGKPSDHMMQENNDLLDLDLSSLLPDLDPLDSTLNGFEDIKKIHPPSPMAQISAEIEILLEGFGPTLNGNETLSVQAVTLNSVEVESDNLSGLGPKTESIQAGPEANYALTAIPDGPRFKLSSKPPKSDNRSMAQSKLPEWAIQWVLEHCLDYGPNDRHKVAGRVLRIARDTLRELLAMKADLSRLDEVLAWWQGWASVPLTTSALIKHWQRAIKQIDVEAQETARLKALELRIERDRIERQLEESLYYIRNTLARGDQPSEEDLMYRAYYEDKLRELDEGQK